ncbi:MAG: glycosyltransferase [Propionibacteriaceae bacterium]|nr:glycosyltransferase [Propionibacteriaceae bacterium]
MALLLVSLGICGQAAGGDAGQSDQRGDQSVNATSQPSATGPQRVLQRVVFPYDADQDVLTLYAEGRQGEANQVLKRNERKLGNRARQQDVSQVLGRRRFRVSAKSRTSFGTYFNAFPASYWRRWTIVEQVTLSVTVSGVGAVIVYRSNARGNIYRVDSQYFSVTAGQPQQVRFDLPLKTFADGGWYWFDVLAGDEPVVIESAQWEAPSDRPQGTVSVGITTLNRPDDVVVLLRQLARDPQLLAIVDRVTVVDQGQKHPTAADGFAAAEAALDGRLRIIRQANLGGSGGFSRGMSETLDEGVSTYHLISDDDVRAEPEGILRAVAFADLASRPTIVGGHMFSMFDRAHLHSMGERVNLWRFWWGSALKEFPDGHHLDEQSLRSTPELHQRIDVDYNGWWMELIPVQVLRQLGLSLPVFIKWDDSEYGLRAKEAGIPTVSLPGVACWHVPWTDKDDALDWQAYYHERNRMVAALLHSPFHFGGRLVRESLYLQVRHLLSAQYSVAELRIQAIEDLLSGPDHLHEQIDTRLAQIRATRAEFDDAKVAQRADHFPLVKRRKVSKRGDDVVLPTNLPATIVMAAIGSLRALKPARKLSREHPEAEIAAANARWFLLSRFDSALVSTSDGSGVSWYKRQPEEFRSLLLRSIALHERLLFEWPQLAQRYREACPQFVSQEMWKQTFARTQAETDQTPAAPTGDQPAQSWMDVSEPTVQGA